MWQLKPDLFNGKFDHLVNFVVPKQGVFKRGMGTFTAVFVVTKSFLFAQEVRSSPTVSAAAKTGHLNQNHDVFRTLSVPKVKQSTSSLVFTCVVLQKLTQPAFHLADGLVYKLIQGKENKSEPIIHLCY